jgi:hypothetical protein
MPACASSLNPDLAPRVPWVRLVRPGTRRTLSFSLTLFALTPLTMLVGTRVAHLIGDPLLGIYGLLMMGVFTLVLYLAFACYRDRASRGQ